MAANTSNQQTQSTIVLTYNQEIERDIKMAGGTVLYSNNNIIIGSEISEEVYRNLLKNPYVDSMYILPLKKYTGQNTQTSDQVNQQAGLQQTNQTIVPPITSTLKQGNINNNS